MELYEKRYTATKFLDKEFGDERDLHFDLNIVVSRKRIMLKSQKCWRSKEEAIEYLEWCIEQVKALPKK